MSIGLSSRIVEEGKENKFGIKDFGIGFWQNFPGWIWILREEEPKLLPKEGQVRVILEPLNWGKKPQIP